MDVPAVARALHPRYLQVGLAFADRTLFRNGLPFPVGADLGLEGENGWFLIRADHHLAVPKLADPLGRSLRDPWVCNSLGLN